MSNSAIKPILSLAAYVTLVVITGLCAGALAITALSAANGPETSRTRSSMEVGESRHTFHADNNILSNRIAAEKIRKAVMTDKSLSFGARNIRVTSDQDAVTLKGAVRSVAERRNLEIKVAELVGEENVVDEILVRKSPAQIGQ